LILGANYIASQDIANPHNDILILKIHLPVIKTTFLLKTNFKSPSHQHNKLSLISVLHIDNIVICVQSFQYCVVSFILECIDLLSNLKVRCMLFDWFLTIFLSVFQTFRNTLNNHTIVWSARERN